MIDPRSTRRYKAVAKAVIERDGVCVICGTDQNLQADHIIPVSVGDADTWYDPNNMQALCGMHNRQKSNKLSGQVADYINRKWTQWERQ